MNFKERKITSDSHFIDLYYCDFHKKNHLDISCPIIIPETNETCFITFRYNATDFLEKMVTGLPVESHTGESILGRFNKDSIILLSNIRFYDEAKLTLKINKNDSNRIANIIQTGKFGIIQAKDYRSKDVLAYAVKIQNTDWFLTVKMDVDEIMHDLKSVSAIVVIFLFLIISVIISISAYVFQSFKKKGLYQQLESEKKISEERLLFETTIFNLGEGVIITDNSNNILLMNGYTEKVTGTTASQSIGKNIYKVLLNESTFNYKQNKDYELSIVDNNGIQKYINYKFNDIIDNNNITKGKVHLFSDITNDVLSKKLLVESESKFKAVFNDSGLGIVIVNADTQKIDICNNHFKKLFEYDDNDDLSQLTIYDLHPEFAHQQIFESFKKLMEFKVSKVTSIPCIKKTGEIFYCDINSSFFKMYGNQVGVGFFTDVTSKLAADKLLNESLERFKQVTNTSSDLIWEINTDGLITYMNPVSEKLLGYKPEEIINKIHFFDLHKNDEREYFVNIAQEILESGKPFKNFENDMLTKSGEIITVISSGSPFFDSDGKILGYRGIDNDITEQKKTEKILKANEERFRYISGCISDISYSCIKNIDTNYEISWMIGAAERITGYTIEELFEMKCWGHIVHPDDFPTFMKKVIKASPGEINFCELRLLNKNGNYIWVESYVVCPEIQNSPDTKVIYGALKDITQAKQTLKLLEKERTYFAQLFKYSPEGIVILDNNDRIQDCNEEFVRMFGYEPDEMHGRLINELIVPKELAYEANTLTSSVTSGKEISVETVRKTKSGELIHVSILGKPIIHNDGNQLAVYAIYRDITDRKNAELALKISEERNRAIVEAIPDLFFVISNDFTFKDCLVHDESKLYAPKAKFLGKKVREIMPEYISEHFEEAVNNLNLTGKMQVFDFILEFNDKVSWYEDRVIRINKDEILIISRDITERKLFENEIIKSKEKAELNDKLKTSFMANMSHELRTPMSGIMGFTQLLSDPDITPEEHNEFIELLKRSNRRLLNLINNILDLSRIEAGEVELINESFNINDMFNEIHSLFKQNAITKGIEFTINTELEHPDAFIYSDESKHHQILSNLVNNAIKFTEEGKIELGYKISDDEIEIYVSDTGVGISVDFLPNLFDRFMQEDISFNRSYEGAGLGLSIVRGLVEIMSGTINVETTKGIGTKISYKIPKINKQENDDMVVIENEPSVFEMNDNTDLPKVKILVAEDDEVNFIYIKKALSKIENAYILHTDNGKTTVDIYHENPDICLVLMDIKMPVMDGIEATKRILALNPNANIIAVTAYAQKSDREAAMEAGCKEYIIKPFLPDELIDIVKKYI